MGKDKFIALNKDKKISTKIGKRNSPKPKSSSKMKIAKPRNKNRTIEI